MVAACWSPAMPATAIAPPNKSGSGFAERVRGILHLRQHRARHVQQLEKIVVPCAGVDIKEQRARGIGGVGRVHLSAGEAPQQVTIDSAEQQFAAHRACTRARDIIEDPGDLGAGKIGIDDQAGLGRDRWLVALVLQPRAEIGGAAVLPDDGAMNRQAGGAIPYHRRFALVGDADRGDILRRETSFLQRVAADGDGRVPDVLRVVLDPAGGRKMLRKFLLRDRRDRKVGAKHHGARGRGALIDGQHEGHWRSSHHLVARKASGLESGRQVWKRLAAAASSSPSGAIAARRAGTRITTAPALSRLLETQPSQ